VEKALKRPRLVKNLLFKSGPLVALQKSAQRLIVFSTIFFLNGEVRARLPLDYGELGRAACAACTACAGASMSAIAQDRGPASASLSQGSSPWTTSQGSPRTTPAGGGDGVKPGIGGKGINGAGGGWNGLGISGGGWNNGFGISGGGWKGFGGRSGGKKRSRYLASVQQVLNL